MANKRIKNHSNCFFLLLLSILSFLIEKKGFYDLVGFIVGFSAAVEALMAGKRYIGYCQKSAVKGFEHFLVHITVIFGSKQQYRDIYEIEVIPCLAAGGCGMCR